MSGSRKRRIGWNPFVGGKVVNPDVIRYLDKDQVRDLMRFVSSAKRGTKRPKAIFVPHDKITPEILDTAISRWEKRLKSTPKAHSHVLNHQHKTTALRVGQRFIAKDLIRAANAQLRANKEKQLSEIETKTLNEILTYSGSILPKTNIQLKLPPEIISLELALISSKKRATHILELLVKRAKEIQKKPVTNPHSDVFKNQVVTIDGIKTNLIMDLDDPHEARLRVKTTLHELKQDLKSIDKRIDLGPALQKIYHRQVRRHAIRLSKLERALQKLETHQ